MNYVLNDALKRTLGDEGGYSNHPDDRGGETYRGISRKAWPDWEGWRVIDVSEVSTMPQKKADEFLASIPWLDGHVEDFYRANFWPAWMDKLPPALAIETFDAAVNHGTSRAARMLQHTVNLLNGNGKTTADIAEDGKPGLATLGALDAVTARRGLDVVLKCFKLLRGRLFIELCEKDPSQEAFLVGWLNNRVRL